MQYKVTTQVHMQAVAIVEADSEKHAKELVSEMEVSACVHGSFFAEEYFAKDDLVLEDGHGQIVDHDDMEIEEYEG